jgi:RNA polymerase sigma-70 factor (ECF subfamily)
MDASHVPADEDLMLQYKAGSQEAFAELVRRHRRGVFHFTLRFLGSPQAAEDALQEVFLRVVRHAPTYERKARFTTWLFTIARNHCIDQGRRAKFRKTESLDAPLSDDEGAATRLDRVPGNALPADQGAESVRIRAALDRALGRLPEEQREVFLLREQAGIPFKEIADMAGVPENTVKSRMRYALEALRRHLETEGVRP